MPKVLNQPKSDDSKQIRVAGQVHQILVDRATKLSQERGTIKPMSLPAYIAEASAFFEAHRPKAKE